MSYKTIQSAETHSMIGKEKAFVCQGGSQITCLYSQKSWIAEFYLRN